MSDAKVTRVEDRLGAFSATPAHVHVVHGDVPKGLRAPGPVLLGHGANVAGDVEARGSVHLARGAHVGGAIRAMGDVILGAGATVMGGVRAEGRVVVQGGASVTGAIDAAGDVHLMPRSKVADLVVGGDLHVAQPVTAPKVRVRGRVFVETA